MFGLRDTDTVEIKQVLNYAAIKSLIHRKKCGE